MHLDSQAGSSSVAVHIKKEAAMTERASNRGRQIAILLLEHLHRTLDVAAGQPRAARRGHRRLIFNFVKMHSSITATCCRTIKIGPRCCVGDQSKDHQRARQVDWVRPIFDALLVLWPTSSFSEAVYHVHMDRRRKDPLSCAPYHPKLLAAIIRSLLD